MAINAACLCLLVAMFVGATRVSTGVSPRNCWTVCSTYFKRSTQNMCLQFFCRQATLGYFNRFGKRYSAFEITRPETEGNVAPVDKRSYGTAGGEMSFQKRLQNPTKFDLAEDSNVLDKREEKLKFSNILARLTGDVEHAMKEMSMWNLDRMHNKVPSKEQELLSYLPHRAESKRDKEGKVYSTMPEIILAGT